MNEPAHDPSIPPPAESELVALVKKMHQQLIYLEKKIDTLIQQSERKPAFRGKPSFGDKPSFRGKPPFRDKPFSKPFRPYDRERRDDRDDRRERPAGRAPYRGGRDRDEGQGSTGGGFAKFRKDGEQRSEGFRFKKKGNFKRKG